MAAARRGRVKQTWSVLLESGLGKERVCAQARLHADRQFPITLTLSSLVHRRMSSKRKSDSPPQSGREKKKQKTAAARTIAVQPAATTTQPQNAAAGPSRTVHFDGTFESVLAYELLLHSL